MDSYDIQRLDEALRDIHDLERRQENLEKMVNVLSKNILTYIKANDEKISLIVAQFDDIMGDIDHVYNEMGPPEAEKEEK